MWPISGRLPLSNCPVSAWEATIFGGGWFSGCQWLKHYYLIATVIEQFLCASKTIEMKWQRVTKRHLETWRDRRFFGSCQKHSVGGFPLRWISSFRIRRKPFLGIFSRNGVGEEEIKKTDAREDISLR